MVYMNCGMAWLMVQALVGVVEIIFTGPAMEQVFCGRLSEGGVTLVGTELGAFQMGWYE